jgi:hypothetical protein
MTDQDETDSRRMSISRFDLSSKYSDSEGSVMSSLGDKISFNYFKSLHT